LDYNPRVLNRWREENCFDEIRRRLGYRFILRNAQIPDHINAGSTMDLSFEVENAGFGELFNPRNVEIVLINNQTNCERVAAISVDPRFWGAGELHKVKVKLTIPGDLAFGQYTLGIRLPDSAPSIHSDPRYSIRFANKNIWAEDSGTNILTKELTVFNPLSGEENRIYKKFSEIH